MYPSIGRLGYPVAKIRLLMSIIAGTFFGFLLYEASVNLKWFTAIRGFYLILGIVNGLLIGEVEARTVIRGLNEKAKTIVWQPMLISAVSFVLPLLVAVAVFGVSEYLPFGAYVVLSFVPIYYGITGWYYNKFEKQNNARILMSPYGFTYWKEPIPDYSNVFSKFIADLARKDYFLIMSPRGYVGHAKRLMAALEAKENIEPSTRKALLGIIQVMNKYRRRMLLVFAAFMVSMFLVTVWLFVLTSTNTFGLQKVAGGRIVSGREITLVLGCIPFFSVFVGCFAAIWFLRKRFQRTISSLLASVDSDKLYSIL